jgi:hypothetical protein
LRLQGKKFDSAFTDAIQNVDFKPEVDIRAGGDDFTTAQSAGEILASS